MNDAIELNETDAPLDVLVIGAGQAGLALGWHLARSGHRFVIVDAGSRIGSVWRSRWDSLTLFTPAEFDGLPGMPFPAPAGTYPTKDQVADYLEAYAAAFDLPVRLDTRVTRLTRRHGVFEAETAAGTLHATQVVVATGPFHVPVVPALAAELSADVVQLHSAAYRRPDDVPPGRVVVVGAGNTGYQIAKELASSRSVHLAVGSRQTPLPQRFLGRDLFWWLTTLRFLDKTVDSRIGRRARTRDTLIGSSPRELRQRYGVELTGRVVGASGRTLRFADGRALEVDGVIWATGYRPDHSWIDLPEFDSAGRLRHTRGVTDVSGLYFLGLSWQHTRGSALLGFVKDDANFLAEQVLARSSPRAMTVGAAAD